ncbi:MAG: shikimate kinase [Pseudomonadota bacterium]
MGRLKKTIVLVGMMGAGKTAVGRALAALLDVPFRDSDQALEAAANMTVAEVFARDGEAFFREKEVQVIARLMALSPPGILSTGGGAFLRRETQETIAAAGLSVWLRAEEPLLWERVRHKETRPLLQTDDPRKTLGELIALREPHYARAGLVVDADANYSVQDMARHVAAAISAHRPDVLETADA